MNLRRYSFAALGGLVALVAVYGYRSGPTPTTGQGCDVTITSHRGSVAFGAGGRTATLRGTSRRCPTATVHILHGATEVGTATASGGAWSYSDTFPDQANTLVTASITSGGVTKTDSFRAVVDTRNPELSIAAPKPALDGTLLVVCGGVDADGCNCNAQVERGALGFYPDQDPASDGGQVALDVTVVGGSGGSLVVSWAGSPILTQALTTSPQEVTGTLTLPEGVADVLTLTATSPTGSVARSIPTGVETVLPNAPRPRLGVPLPDGGYGPYPDGGVWTHVVNERHADLDLAVDIDDSSQRVEWWVTTSTDLASNGVTPYPDGGLLAPTGYYPDGGKGGTTWPDGGPSVVSFGYLVCHNNPAVHLVRDVPGGMPSVGYPP